MRLKIVRLFGIILLFIYMVTLCSTIVSIEKYESEETSNFFIDILRGVGIPPAKEYIGAPIERLMSESVDDDLHFSNFSINSKIGGSYARTDWVDTRWKFRKNITIDHNQVPADLENFPVYVELFDTDLQEHAQASGNDIFFTNEKGKVLDFEIEQYLRTYNSSHAKLVAWVRANVSSSAPDTILTIYYGNPLSSNHENPSGVWDNNYLFVLHMDQDPSISDILDSSQNGFDFDVEPTSNMNSDDLVIAQTGKGISFDGSDDYIFLPYSENFIGSVDKMTFEFWIMFPNGGPVSREWLAAPGTTSHNPRLSFNYNFDFRVEGILTSTSELTSALSSFSANTWYYITAIWDGTGDGLHEIYINGLWDNDDSTPLAEQHIEWNTFAIGAEDDETNGVGGDNPHNEINAVVGEFRLSNSVRDSNWIWTQFSNQKDPRDFFALSSEEESPTQDDWLLPLYKYRKNIHINSSQISGTLVNFPILIDVIDSDLSDTSKVQSDGDDIAFTSNEGWIWSDELISNGGFETGNFAGWTVSGNWAVGTDPSQGDKGPQAGSYCAYVSSSGQSTDYIQQDINIGSYASYIDSGKAISNVTGWMVAAEDGFDYCNMAIEYLDNIKSVISTPVDKGNLLPTSWTKYGAISDLIPINTRYIRIRASCCEEGWDAGSLDSFSVKIGTYQSLTRGFQLSHDIDYFDQGTGHLVAWVNVPRLASDTNNNITIYYGNDVLRNNQDPSNVWKQYHEAVWHLSEESGSSSYIVDSTMNGYDGTPSGTQYLQSGLVGGARDFIASGVNEIVMDDGSELLDGWDAFTISFWIYPNFASDSEWESASNGAVFYKQQSAWLSRIWRVSGMDPGVGKFQVDLNFENSGTQYINVDIYRQYWNWIVYSFDGQYLRIFVNGSFMGSNDLGSDKLVSDTSQFKLGNGASTFKGYLDEFQLLNYGKTVDWVTTEYTNIDDPTSFYTVGEEENSSKWWADTSFGYRRDIVIDRNEIAGDLRNFPVLIDISSTSFKESQIRSDANDILFTDEFQNKLDFEIDYFSQTPTQGRLITWVKIPYLYESVDTVISLYYGGTSPLESQQDPVGVWESDVGVWHLSEDPSDTDPQFSDSTGNSNDGTAVALTTSNQVTGIIDGSLEFDDTNERHVEVNHSSSLQLSSNISVFTWVKTTDSDSDVGVIVAKWGSQSTDRNYWLGKLDAANIAFYVDDTQTVSSNLNLINNDIWHLVVGVADALNGQLRLYVDGVLRNSASYDGTSFTGSSSFHVGNSPGEIFQEWNGLVDEVRVSGRIYSVEWQTTSYNNQLLPSNFIVVSGEREFDVISPTLNDFGVDDLGTGTGVFWAQVTDNLAGVSSVKLEVNGIPHLMSDNGTHWIHQETVDYLGYYEYQIINASDSVGNYLINPSIVRNYTFINDIVAPDVIDWKYIRVEDRFYANVTDSWGTIDTVIVEVTAHTVSLPDPPTAVMQFYQDFGSDLLGYLNDTIEMSSGDIEFRIFVNDSNGNSYTSSPHPGTVFKNHPPVVSDLTLDTAPYHSNSPLELSYNYTDEDGHAEVGTEIRWYKNNGTGFQLVPDKNNSLTISASLLFKDDEWYVTVRPKDGQAFGDLENSTIITITNTPPIVQSVQLNPISAYTTSALTILNTTSDYDGDTITKYYIEWFVNSIHDPTYDNEFQINPISTTKNEFWYCHLRAFDGTDNSTWVNSNTITILNSLPKAVNLSITPAQPYNTSILTANWDMQDADGDSENKSLAIIYWFKYGIPQLHLTNSTYINPDNTSKGQLWSFKIRVWDGTAYSGNYSISPIEILNSVPTVKNVEILISNPQSGDDLPIGWYYSDLDNDSAGTPLIKWYRDNELIYENYDPLPSSVTTKGEYWHYGIQVFDGEVYSAQVNSTQVYIENTVPIIESLSLTSDAKTLDDLIASWNALDNDTSDDLEFNVTFYLNGNKNSSWLTTSSSVILESGNTTKHDLWYFTVEAFDGDAYSNIFSLESNVTIYNSLPIVPPSSATFNKTTPLNNEGFNITYQFTDVDGDVENLSKIFVYWFVDSGAGFEHRLEFQNYTEIHSDNTSDGQIWYYKLRVSDNEGYSINVTSILGVQIGTGGPENKQPKAWNLTIKPISPNTTQSLIANYTYFDFDDDPQVAVEILWYMNNDLQPEFTNLLTISSSVTEKGQEWNFTVKVFDGTDWSPLNSSDTITVSNAEPFASNLDLTSNIYTDDNLIASWQAFDYDSSDSLTYNITWYQNGVKNYSWITSDLSAVLNHENTTKNANWTFSIQVFDGIINSQVFSLDYNVTILNSAPIAANLTITSNPRSIDDLIAGWDYDDIDGDPEADSSAIITWYKNGENQTGLFNNDVIDSGNLGKDEKWWFTVQVSDGEDHSLQIYESNHVTILNTEPLISGSQLPVPSSPTRLSGIDLNLNDILLAFNDPDLDDIEIIEISWYRNNVSQEQFAQSLSIDGDYFTKGETWNYSVIVTDGLSNSSVLFSQVFQIKNSKPVVENSHFEDTDVKTNDDLVIIYQATDVDNDPITVANIIWELYNSTSGEYDIMTDYNNTMVLPSNATTKGEIWLFEIQVTDGLLVSEWDDPTIPIVIENSVPRIIIDSITISGGETTQSSLTVNYYWEDDDPEDDEGATGIIWESSTQYITNESTNLPSKYTVAGERWWVTIRPHDGEDYGEYYDSKQFGVTIIIGNTPPYVIPDEAAIFGILNETIYDRSTVGTTLDLVVKYNASDIDGDQGVVAYDIVLIEGDYVSNSEYHWYRNRSGIVTQVSTLNGKTKVPFYFTQRGDIWWCEIKPRDLYGDFGSTYNSTPIIIGNTAPKIRDISWLNDYPTANDNLSIEFDYFDADNDPIVESKTLILWYKNGNLIFGTENQTTISNTYFIKDDNITVIIRPFDGKNWAACNFTSGIIRIQNSPPIINEIILEPLVFEDLAILCLNWSYYDLDGDPESNNYYIRWIRNGGVVPEFENSSYIPLITVSNGDLWRVELKVNDGTNYSVLYLNHIYTKVVRVEYVFEASSNVDPNIRIDEFCVEDENIRIIYQFSIQNDALNSLIQWYKIFPNGTYIEVFDFENSTSIPYWATSVGERWYCTITPFDGKYYWRRINTSRIIILSRPIIETLIEDIVIALSDIEGHYLFNLTVGDTENPVTFVEYTLNDTVRLAEQINQNTWVLDYQLPINNFASLEGTLIVGEVKVGYSVNQSFDVFTFLNLNFTVVDSAAPRVFNAYFAPSEVNITFFAEVEEFGSGINSVICHYYFEPVNETEGGAGGSINHYVHSSQMTFLNSTDSAQLYLVTIPFKQNGTDWRVIYWIETFDNAGNHNPRAFDVLRDEPESVDLNIIKFIPPGLPQWILLVAGAIIFLIFFGAVVYVRFIRKAELVGLDKEMVMKGIAQFSDAEISSQMEHHTIGGMVSFFDQRHGPIPIVVHPEVLKDNFPKLVDLSDKSFSSTGFSSNFTTETTSSYDYVLDQDLLVAVMSFGFSLDKPQARGGQENITFNLIIYKDLFDLLNQFLNEIKVEVHKLHMIMNDPSTPKQQLRNDIVRIRKYVTSIIMSYESQYGTTELLEEEI
ncbi:MAG: DUF2341 domain-containing protein [Promethearchaeota archaeon]